MARFVFQAHVTSSRHRIREERGAPVSIVALGEEARPSLRLQLTELGDGLLDDLLADSDRSDQTPVRVRFPIPTTRRVAEVHDALDKRDVLGCRQGGRSALHGILGRAAPVGQGVVRASRVNFPRMRSVVRKLGQEPRRAAR